MTALLGATLAVPALAMTLPTTTFLAVRPVRWLVIAATFGYPNRAP